MVTPEPVIGHSFPTTQCREPILECLSKHLHLTGYHPVRLEHST